MTAKRPSRQCRALLLEMSRYLDGELSPPRRRAIEKHIGTCACCGAMALRLRTVVAACRAEGNRRAPRAVMARAAARIRALLEAHLTSPPARPAAAGRPSAGRKGTRG